MEMMKCQRIEQKADFKTDKYEVGHTTDGLLYWRKLGSPVYHYTRKQQVILERVQGGRYELV